MPEQVYKRCKDCGEKKPLDQFWRAPRNSDGRRGRCMECDRERQRERREKSGVATVCANCGETFKAKANYSSFRQKHCSLKCEAEVRHKKAVASYPPRDEIEALYQQPGMSDLALGRHYGRSYQWAFKVRCHYGIAGAEPTRNTRKPLHRKNDRSRWGIHLKPEPCCRACGKPAEETGKGLNLHHALPRSLAPAIKYDLRNGIPLCAGCHLGWHRNEVTIYQDVFTREEWEFLSNLKFTGFMVRPWLDRRYPVRPVG
jgi:hypothetical protein